MPELPEVEVVRRGLEPHVSGRVIRSVEVHHDRSVRRHPGGANDFRAVLSGRRIESVRRRGKYLWWALDEGDAVVAHLGMSGQFRVGTEAGSAGYGDVALPPVPMTDEPADGGAGPVDRHPHLRIRFTLTDPSDPSAPPSTVDFLDQRTFGGMAFAPGGAELPEVLAHIARDPLDPAFDLDRAVAAIRAKRSEIKRVLLDQTVVSGIGNIYADEALWTARLHYARPTATLTRTAAAGVITAATEVMTSALAVGGTSFDALYVNVDGESGYFARSLHAYGRAGEPCDRCGTPLRRDAFMNRSSFFCPQCQRPPRAPRRPSSI